MQTWNPFRQLAVRDIVRDDSASASPLVIPALGITLGTGLFFLLLLPFKYAVIGIFVLFAPLVAMLTGLWRTAFLTVLVLGIPLQLKKTLYGYTLGHICGPGGIDFTMADGALILLLVHWLYRIVVQKHRTFLTVSRIDLWILLFIFLNGISLLSGTDLTLGIIDFIRVIKVAFIYLYLANNIKTLTDLRIIVAALLAGTLVHIAISVVQYRLGHPIGLVFLGEVSQFGFGDFGGGLSRPSGIMQGANTSATFLLGILPLAFTAAFWARNRLMKSFDLLIFFSGLITLIITSSRGGWLGFAFAGLIMLILLVRRGYLKYRSHYLYALGMGAVIFSAVAYLSPKIIDRLMNASSIPTHTRTFLNRTALSIIGENPFTGVGLNNFAEHAGRVIRGISDPEHIFRYIAENPVVHNLYLLIAAETGIVSLIVFMVIVFSLMRLAWNATKNNSPVIAGIGIAIFSFLSGFLVAELFDFSYRLDHVFYLFWSLAGMTVALGRISTPEVDEMDNTEDGRAV
ncbi:MAG: O-antigen ligase family protein [Nitrospira sp.]|nr:O-antigen ligase family protein [bacterium]MBL7048000.1 O-antigen ligase family protein [Nitrospira sp.]